MAENGVKVARTDREPFCDVRGLWYTSINKLSAQQGRRQGFEFPWGHVSPLAIMWAMERERFEYSKRSLLSVVEKH